MSHYLLVETDLGAHKMPLDRGVARLGSGSDCQLQLEHPEVEPRALTLDLRGQTLLLRSHNPYAVYLGDLSLEPGRAVAWPLGEPLRLTRSVTLTYRTQEQEAAVRAGAPATETVISAQQAPAPKKNVVQIAVIGVCILIGLQQLTGAAAPSDAARGYGCEVGFEGLIERIDQQIAASPQESPDPNPFAWRTARGCLQEARYYERRVADRTPDVVAEAYERLLECEALAGASPDGEDLPSLIHRFAAARRASLELKK